MNQKENVASALGSILLGILLIVMKGKIITAAIALLAVFVIVGAIMDFVAGLVNYGIVKSVAGICILVFGWVFASLASTSGMSSLKSAVYAADPSAIFSISIREALLSTVPSFPWSIDQSNMLPGQFFVGSFEWVSIA